MKRFKICLTYTLISALMAQSSFAQNPYPRSPASSSSTEVVHNLPKNLPSQKETNEISNTPAMPSDLEALEPLSDAVDQHFRRYILPLARPEIPKEVALSLKAILTLHETMDSYRQSMSAQKYQDMLNEDRFEETYNPSKAQISGPSEGSEPIEFEGTIKVSLKMVDGKPIYKLTFPSQRIYVFYEAVSAAQLLELEDDLKKRKEYRRFQKSLESYIADLNVGGHPYASVESTSRNGNPKMVVGRDVYVVELKSLPADSAEARMRWHTSIQASVDDTFSQNALSSENNMVKFSPRSKGFFDLASWGTYFKSLRQPIFTLERLTFATIIGGAAQAILTAIVGMGASYLGADIRPSELGWHFTLYFGTLIGLFYSTYKKLTMAWPQKSARMFFSIFISLMFGVGYTTFVSSDMEAVVKTVNIFTADGFLQVMDAARAGLDKLNPTSAEGIFKVLSLVANSAVTNYVKDDAYAFARLMANLRLLTGQLKIKAFGKSIPVFGWKLEEFAYEISYLLCPFILSLMTLTAIGLDMGFPPEITFGTAKFRIPLLHVMALPALHFALLVAMKKLKHYLVSNDKKLRESDLKILNSEISKYAGHVEGYQNGMSLAGKYLLPNNWPEAKEKLFNLLSEGIANIEEALSSNKMATAAMDIALPPRWPDASRRFANYVDKSFAQSSSSPAAKSSIKGALDNVTHTLQLITHDTSPNSYCKLF
ncbi:MAG: hypothetical protein COT74_01260 [Bdellovibrionales bacterium CG10_big_fil_rev_8_21_14_0_10_45_34]|nr:MAG: hypothetical protein COT74_01260 [Bdellovibrionales bacterium CG10_big_fil_rev_8_21_14_0_10_45_34]